APAETYGAWAVGTVSTVIGARSLLATEGEIHKSDRKLLTPPFHGSRMRAYGDEMRSLARRRFEQAFVPGKTVKTQDVMVDVTVDVILRTVFGVADGPALDEGRVLLARIVSVSPLLFFSKATHSSLFPPYRRFVRVREQFRAWLDARIDEARARGERG